VVGGTGGAEDLRYDNGLYIMAPVMVVVVGDAGRTEGSDDLLRDDASL